MTRLFLENLPLWVLVPSLVAFAALGTVFGILYFRTLGLSVWLLVEGGKPMLAIAAGFGRFAVLGGALALASFCGALPLLAMALGILIARRVILRHERKARP